MENSLMQIFGAALMLVVVFAVVAVWRKYVRANSERRMLAMLESVGLDPAMAFSVESKAIMSAVRERCRHCQTEDVCERWLKGEVGNDNDFCPNSKVFEFLNQQRSTAA